ncbi:MAG TPA: alkaline phosphatase family protein [Candidatus Binatia bacterium]|nr:alkaline phosphatase family protein [Candidatus Binatia bacterium]
MPPPPPRAGKYFTHIVVLIQENRSFDNLFATFPGADGATRGKMKVLEGSKYVDKWTTLRPHALLMRTDLNHCHAAFVTAYDGGKMDGFNLEHTNVCGAGQPAGTLPYQYVDPSQIRPYWELAQQYVLADHTFQTQGSGSFIAHQDLIRGGTEINSSESLIDNPTAPPWGCDAPTNTVTSLITTEGKYLKNQGPFPCLSYPTLRDLLDGAQLPWKYYAPAVGQSIAGDLFNPFDAISAVRNGPEWATNQTSPETKIFRDVANDSLPCVAWVVPDYANSDHPGNQSDTGPSWVAQVVNAIGESPSWKTTAIVIVWDDWGGLYDHEAPPFLDEQGGLGFRIPMLVVSPYAKAGYVSHARYEFGSIVRFIEDNWRLGRLGTTDVRSADFVHDFFDFTQHRKFVPIRSEYSRPYFLDRAPSNRAVDDE